MCLNQPICALSTPNNLVHLFNIHTLNCWYQLPICYIHRINSHHYHGGYRSQRMCTFTLFVSCLFCLTWHYSSQRFHFCLSIICFVFLLRNQRGYAALSTFLSSTSWAELYYLTALLPFIGTSTWTRAQESSPSGRTLRRAATGWGLACLTGCGRTCSRASEFTSGIWRKRPSCRLPRCVWQVTYSADDSKQLYLGVLTWPLSTTKVKAAFNCKEFNLFRCVTFLFQPRKQHQFFPARLWWNKCYFRQLNIKLSTLKW